MMPWYQTHEARSWFSHEPSSSSHADSYPSSTCASARPHKKGTSEGAGRVAARIVNDFLGQSSRTIPYIIFERRRKWDAASRRGCLLFRLQNRTRRDSPISLEIINWIRRNRAGLWRVGKIVVFFSLFEKCV